MKFKTEYFVIVAVVVANSFVFVKCWDSDELELFDLVEEVNTNFYTLLGVLQTSESKKIRHAFRNLSLKLHPDKNDAPDAEVKFRQLVAVYEVLRDPVKRKRYDEVLENGLPDWRHAVYYYRRVRKMGLFEMLIILFIIITIGQYIVAWAAYLEKKYIVEEYLNAHKKRLQRKQRRGKLEGDLPDMTIEIPKPSVKNTLPFQIPRFVWSVITCIPVSIKFLIEHCIKTRKKEIHESSEEEEEPEPEVWTKGPRRRKNFAIPEIKEDVKYNGGCILDPLESPDKSEKEIQKKPMSGLWTDDDLTELIRLVNKYPPGTSNRWEKVADTMGRNVAEVTLMAKKVKEGMVVRTEDVEEIAEESKKLKTKGGKLAKTDVVKEKEWTQVQQKTLEDALMKFPKQSAERWEKIAKMVPGKTKEECMLRYKQLHEIVKKKRESDS